MKKRSQIEEKYKWNLNDIFESEDLLMSSIENLKTYPDQLASYKGKLKKVNKCLEFFELSTEVSKEIEKV